MENTEQQLTEEQQQANKQLLEQLQRVPVLQKHVQILERQGMQQRSEIAELAVLNEQLQQQMAQMAQKVPTEKSVEEQEQDENSES